MYFTNKCKKLYGINAFEQMNKCSKLVYLIGEFV